MFKSTLEYVYFMGFETLPSTCYTFSDESSIPFYSTSNGYKNEDDRKVFKMKFYFVCFQCVIV